MSKGGRSEAAARYKPKHPFLAGAITGGIEICITYPFEYAKCQLQLKPTGQQASETLLSVLRLTLKSKGVYGLYDGISAWLFFSFPRAAFRFSTYEYVLRIFETWRETRGDHVSNARHHTGSAVFVAGIVAGLVESSSCMTPMHCIQIKMQQDSMRQHPVYRNFFHATKCIVHEEGFRHGLFAGMTPTVLKQCLNSLIRFGSMYEMTKWRRNQIQSHDPAVPLPTKDVFFLGAIAGAISAVASHPIDTVKSNMQGNKEHIAKFHHSTIGCVKHIYGRGGLLAFYSGLTPRLIRVTIEQATTFALFDRISRALDQAF